MRIGKRKLGVWAAALLGIAISHAAAAEPSPIPLATLEKAQAITSWHAAAVLPVLRPEPYWIGNSDRFWFKDGGASPRFTLVDARTGAARPAFDHDRMLAALNAASGKTLTALPFDRFRFSPAEDAISFDFDGAGWTCPVDAGGGSACVRAAPGLAAPDRALSPDGSKAIAFDGANLTLLDGSKPARALTTDGVDGNAYGRSYGGNANMVVTAHLGIPEAPAVLWSPDSRYVLTERIDERDVGKMPLTAYLTGEKDLHPKVYSYRLGMPGDAVLPRSTLVVIDTETGNAVPIPGSEQPETLGTRLNLGMIWWADARTAYFIVHDRPFRSASLHRFDAATGTVRKVVAETSATFLSLGQVMDHQFMSLGLVAREVPGSEDVLWYSERSGWGHLYLYDGRTGRLKRQLTSGPWLVHEIIRVDPRTRTVYFTAGGHEKDDNPYHARLYSVGLDGGKPRLLTPESSDHALFPDRPLNAGWQAPSAFSPSGRYFVDTYAGIADDPVSVIRTASGALTARFHRADLGALRKSIPNWPTGFTVKARDGKTDLNGVLFRPSGFDPAKRYPVIDYIYPGPFNTWTPRSILDRYVFLEAQALAELGFVVTVVDALGSAGRSKAFHDVAWRNLQDAGLPDHVAMLDQLANRHEWIDRGRVGALGISSGGFASALALLEYPGTFSVAVSAAGIYDQRIGFAGWTERYQGLAEGDAAPPSNYAPFVLAGKADKLRGKLMIAFGNMDENAHPAVAHRFIDALNRAGKPYELVLMVDSNHGFALNPYYVQRYWGFFLENLQGSTLPPDFKLD